LLAAFLSLCGPPHPKPSRLGWACVIMEARWSDAALHHSPSWSNSPYIAWRCVGSLSCWKKKDSHTKHKPDGMACHCRLPWWSSVPWILNKSQTVSPAKHHHTTTASMLHGGNYTCEDHLFTYSASHKDTAVETKNLKFGLIRPMDTFPHFHQNVTIYQSKTVTLFLFCRHRYRLYTVATTVSSPFKKYSSTWESLNESSYNNLCLTFPINFF
jgi:hypothetical protein